MEKKNDADMLAAMVQAANRYAMRPALVLDAEKTHQNFFNRI